MFMEERSSTEEQLILTHENLKTPSPLSPDSDKDGSSESLLSEINEVYNSLESNYQLTKTNTFKNLGSIQEKQEASAENTSENSSPTSLKKRLSNVSSRLPELLGYASRSISKDVFSHLQTEQPIDEKEETDPIHEHKPPPWDHNPPTHPDPRTSVARARRRARMYSSSPERSFRGTSSDEGPVQNPTNAQDFIHNKIRKSLNPEMINANHKMIAPNKSTSSLQESADNPPQRANKKFQFPRLLEPLEATSKRRNRRKNEVFTSSSMSYSTSPEPTQRRKAFGSFVPHLNLQNCQSTDPSLLSTNREEERRKDNKNLDIDELVESLSDIPLKPNKYGGRGREFRAKSVPVSSRTHGLLQRKDEQDLELKRDEEREKDSRTFRIEKEQLLNPKAKIRSHYDRSASIKMPWELKPTNAATDLLSGRSETSICPFNSHSNASTQVNMRSSLSSLQNSRPAELPRKSQDRFPFTISETSTLSPQHHCKNYHHHLSLDHMVRRPDHQVTTAEVIYENKNCRCNSSSDSASAYSNSPDKNMLSPAKMMSSNSKPPRKYEQDDKWTQSVSYLTFDGINHSQDRYSVFFVKDAQVESLYQGSSDDHLPCVHRSTCHHAKESNFPEKYSGIRSEAHEEDLDGDLVEECFCLKFCNLFHKRSQMMSQK